MYFITISEMYGTHGENIAGQVAKDLGYTFYGEEELYKAADEMGFLDEVRKLDISWLGHSCFRIKGNRTTIITDPYSPDLGYSLGKPTARIVTVSHQHPGHSYSQGIGGEPKLVTSQVSMKSAVFSLLGRQLSMTERKVSRGVKTLSI
jgi:hypothetical protein